MKKKLNLYWFVLVITFLFSNLVFAQVSFANDSIFKPQAAAENRVNFDGQGFLIDGQRTFIASAGIEYARIPRELWADRLLRIKRAGMNAVEIYTFWNYHEPVEGQFNFSGNRDLDAFLKLAKSLGLYAIVRVGPYYCAEWGSGGYPVWLQFKDGLTVRQHNAVFEQAVSNFWDHLFPIVINNQINRGGNVILVQLENEHDTGWGTDGVSDPYFKFLQSKALSYGLEVPYFFSGLNHGTEPGGTTPWSSSGRTSPWFTTEFWTNWFDRFGETPDDVVAKDRATWKILSNGGNGYNYYMFHGGSNFDYFNSDPADKSGASYDYGAPIGEGGVLRQEYYKFKRAAWFARSFQSILETSDNATGTYSTAASNSNISVTARQSNAGRILFLDNAGSTDQQTKVNYGGVSYPQTGSLTVKSKEIMPFVANYQVIPGVTLTAAPTRILGITQQINTSTIVIYGQSGSPAEMYFKVPAGTVITSGASALSQDASGNMSLKTTFPASGVSNYSFQTGSSKVRILAVNDALADNTWFVNAGGSNYVVLGPQYVGDANIVSGSLQINAETTWQNASNFPVVAYDSGDSAISMGSITTPGAHPGTLTLSSWQTMSGIDKAATGYNTTGWFSSTTGPKPMGIDGDVSAYAWYRTTANLQTAGTYSITFDKALNNMIPYVDGNVVPSANVSTTGFSANLSPGNHTIAVFVSHNGRDKLFAYRGSLNPRANLGIIGSANIANYNAPTALTSWKTMMTTSSAVGTTPPSSSDTRWTSYTLGGDPFSGAAGYAWFQTTLPSAGSSSIKEVSFNSVDDNSWVYLNGVQIATNTGWNVPFKVNVSNNWNASGANTLTVLVQNTSGIGGINSPVNFEEYSNRSELKNWVQQGGPGDPNSPTGWSTLAGGATFSGPQFFKTTFNASPPGGTGTNPIWRITTTGLSRGSMWVNGHNLGKYPLMISAPGVYVPETWLNTSGTNTLVIYDEQGKRPDQVVVQPEASASRDVIAYSTSPGNPPPSGIVSGNTYRIVNRNSGKVLDVKDQSTADGAIIQQWSYSGGNNQKWVFTQVTGGYWKIKSVNSGKLMDISGASTADGAANIQWPDNGGNNQQWQLVDAGNGYYKIKNRNSEKILDISGASTADGAPDIQWPDIGGTNQMWQILPA
ncbi:hypothetical protein D7Z26_13770 [Cohnella endophytica]|uniref:Ricin B lectin domain-containing protein n=1 Tax=Cohnella endophytica TaxID=2419778 RepID=A0A494XWY7_9BACL|nr:beta-galactosidase [Cohnella endophytica]RKP54415.1 hypothetical protein D7Z26_13770 [Cohnella endophytica]